jgi:hypothetical protein
MKKVMYILGGLVGLIVLAVAGLLVVASMQPDVIHVERSTTVQAQAQDVYPLIDDYRQFVAWSPWTGRDPNQTAEFSDPASGKDAWYTWEGNKEVGKGKMTTLSVDPPNKVAQHLEFIDPFPSKAEIYLEITPAGDGVAVTWGFDQQADLMTKAMTLFMDMDAMLGGDFEEGLANLKGMGETAAAAREEAERQAAEAAAEVEADGEGEEAEGS